MSNSRDSVTRQAAIYKKWRKIAARNSRITYPWFVRVNRGSSFGLGVERERRIELYAPPDSLGFHDIRNFSSLARWRVQKKVKGRYRSPLSYVMTKRVVTQDTVYGVDYIALDVGSWGAYDNALLLDRRAFSYAKAYEKFKSDLGDSALWATNLHERDQAVRMITFRAVQLARFVKALNRFDVPGAWKVLGLGKPSSGSVRRSLKGISNAFLEVHFGWVPLVQDIESSVRLLASDPPFKRVVGRGTYRETVKIVNDTSFGDGTRRSEVQVTKLTLRCKIQADVRCDNTNLFLASKLGLVNPASFVWEAIPFSFVVDWFANVGSFLSSYTDFLGVSMQDISVTHYTEAVRSVVNTESHSPFRPDNGRQFGTHQIDMQRTLPGSLPGPSLRVTPYHGLSVTHGVTAVALLLQRLGR